MPLLKLGIGYLVYLANDHIGLGYDFVEVAPVGVVFKRAPHLARVCDVGVDSVGVEILGRAAVPPRADESGSRIGATVPVV